MQILRKIYHSQYTTLLLILLLILQLGILSNITRFPDKPVTLSFLVLDIEYDSWIQMTKNLTIPPNIKLEVRKLANADDNYTTDYMREIYRDNISQSRPNYDLVYMDIIWLPEFAKSDLLTDLSMKIKPEELAQFLDSEVEYGKWDNKLYRIPFRSDTGVIFYRKDWLKKAPKTFDELREMSQNLQKSEKVNGQYVWQGAQYEGLVATFVEVLSKYGGCWICDKNHPGTYKVGLDDDDDKVIEAIIFLQNLLNNNISPSSVQNYTEENSYQEFIDGKAAFVRGWPDFWAKGNADNSPIKEKIGITSMTDAKGKSRYSCRGGWGFGIAKKTQHPKEAWEAIKYLTSENFQREFVLKTSYLPSRKALFNKGEVVKKYPHFPNMLQTLEQADFRPKISVYSRASKILQGYLYNAVFKINTSNLPEKRRRQIIQTDMQKAATETRDLLNKSYESSN